MSACRSCGDPFTASFDGQRYCWECWQDGAGVSRNAGRRDYGDYLDSRDWRLQRAYRIELAGGRCEECGATRLLQAHHNTYDRVGEELLEDLDVLCRPCHEREHGIEPEVHPMAASRTSFSDLVTTTGGGTVTLRTVTVDGRSMTVAAYRQLPERTLIGWDGVFKGEPWGWVNLCPSRDCPTGAHRHVIWRDGTGLCRDVCTPAGRFEPWSDWGDVWAVLAAADTTRRHLKWNGRTTRVTFVENLPAVECTLPGRDYSFERAVAETQGKAEPPPCSCEPSRAGGEVQHYGCEVTWRKAQAMLEERAAKEEHTLKEVDALIRAEVREQHAAYVGRSERWGDVGNLPQLFLGV